MIALITLIFGFILGILIHMFTMKISFKQRTLDNKIKIYDSIISSWVMMRNKIYSEADATKWQQLDQIYGESQKYIGEIFLVTENDELARDINKFNEQFYRQNWHSLDLATANKTIEQLKVEGLSIISRMRNDIYDSTVLTQQDISHIWSGIKTKKKSV